MNKSISRYSLVLFCLLLIPAINGCQFMKKSSTDVAGDQIEQVFANAEQETGVIKVPEDISQALIPKMPLDLSNVDEDSSNRFDISVRNMPAREFFMNLVQDTPYNIIVHPSIDGTISLSVKDVTVAEVMEIVKNVYGYNYISSGFGFEVLPEQLQSRTFIIDYLNISREGASETTVSAGQVSQADSGNSSSSSDSDSSSSDSSTRSVVAGSKITTSYRADFWGNIDKTVRAIIGNGPGRSVVANPQSGLLVVRAMTNELNAVAQFLRNAQDSLHRQVILEAKILEVKLQDGFQAGINWGGILLPGDDQEIVFGQVGGGSSLSGRGISSLAGVTGSANEVGNLNPKGYVKVDNLGIQAFGGVFSAALNLNDFTSFIELLETQGNVQVLSSPRISTINNQKAVIKVGEDEYFVTDVSNPQVVGNDGTVTQTPEVELTPFFSGIALDVTPQISKLGVITLHVHPTVSQVSEQFKTIEIEGLDQRLPLAKSIIRESDSIVRARSGQIVVIGGLMKTNTDEVVSSIPVLGSMPFVGSAFRQTRQQSSKSELVILLKPVLINSNTWSENVALSAKRFKTLRRGFHHSSKADIFGNEAEFE